MKNKRGSKRPTYRVGEVIVRVDLELPQSITAEKEEKLLSSANNAALEVMRDYIDQVRTHEGQFWLGHSADEPCSGVVDALEVDTGKRVVGPRYTIVLPPTTKKPLSTVAHEKALAAVATGNKPELADRLLADARHLLVLGDKYREAVLMAAIAAEVKIKEYLLKVCPEEGRSILEFALKNPRDVSLQAASLYDKGAEAVVGKSLRKDDKEAYKAVENLFAVRNKVAHEARETDGKEASKCVNAAERAIAWADSLLLSDEETGK